MSTPVDAIGPSRSTRAWLGYLGLPLAGGLWWFVDRQLGPFAEWLTSLLPVARASHTGEALAFFG